MLCSRLAAAFIAEPSGVVRGGAPARLRPERRCEKQTSPTWLFIDFKMKVERLQRAERFDLWAFT